MTASVTSLVDHVSRQTITGELDRTLFVEAGAGSGKTTAVVARVVELVRSGVDIDHIAAITFTEAAASELRIRVRDQLEEEGRRSDDRRLLDAAARVEGAAFTTLHGFALQLLTDHPVEAGLPPGFGVADEISSILAFEDAWRVFSGRMGDDLDLLELQARAAVLGCELKKFVDVAHRFDDNWDLLGDLDVDPPPLPTLDFTGLLDQLRSLAAMRSGCRVAGDKLGDALEALEETIAEVEADEPLDQLARLDHSLTPKLNAGKAANWGEPSIAEVKDAVKEARAAIDAVAAVHKDAVMRQMGHHVARFVHDRVEGRRAAGELSFHDLLVLARRLLRSDEQVRQRLHQRYRRILLDEFQDTDQIQIELAVLLAVPDPPGERPWLELAAAIPPGRLVVVGDPKQSIYRFRRADIGVYSDAEGALVDAPTQLVTNFRSVPGIVHFVNEVFGAQMGDGEPGAQPAYTALTPARLPCPDDAGLVRVLGGPDDAESVSELRRREAIDVAAVACRVIEEGWLVERDGAWVPARLGDIAVLIPSRLSLPSLESAFAAANVPFRPETSSLVYATQEVREVMAAVRAVADSANAVDVVAALRSSLFAVGDAELLAWHGAGGRWDYRVDHPEAVAALGVEHPVAVAYGVLRAWRERRWWDEPAALVDRIVVERRLREQALAAERPRDRWRRYRFLTEQARQFAATQGGDLLDFVAWVEIQSSESARVTEPIPAEPDDDAVRVLTVHGSKGLEFPIVVLAGAPTQESNRRPGPKVHFDPDGGPPEVSLGKDRSTAQFEARAAVEELLDAHERIRLHYVAATRARDHLVVSAHHRVGRRCIGGRTWDAIQELEGWETFEARGDERYDAAPPTQLRLAGDDFATELATWQREQAALVAGAAAGSSTSATAVAHADDTATAVGVGPGRMAPDPADTERESWRRGRAGSAFGSAVHAVLQHLDLSTGSGLADLARLHAAEEGLPHLADEVAARAERVRTCDVIVEAAAARHWRELYLAFPATEGGTVVEGYVDLVYERPDGLVVVDFKTDWLPADDDAAEAAIDRLMTSYRLQGATYAIGLEQVTGRPVVDCVFLFATPEGVRTRRVEDLDNAKVAVQDRLR